MLSTLSTIRADPWNPWLKILSLRYLRSLL
jgi:hypothetical protein